MTTNSQFRDKVYELVAQIPEGRVMTYGQIAALCGNPQASRIVGGVAHFGPHTYHTDPACFQAEPATPPDLLANRVVARSSAHLPYVKYDSIRPSRAPSASLKCGRCGHGEEIPWQRVVMKNGGLAAGFPGGKRGHATMLRAEGVKVSDDYRIDVDSLIYWPNE